MLNTLNSATPDNMMPPESGKRTEAASSVPEARGAVLKPVIDGWAVTRPVTLFRAARLINRILRKSPAIAV
jgi:hypothetical protein